MDVSSQTEGLRVSGTNGDPVGGFGGHKAWSTVDVGSGECESAGNGTITRSHFY